MRRQRPPSRVVYPRPPGRHPIPCAPTKCRIDASVKPVVLWLLRTMRHRPARQPATASTRSNQAFLANHVANAAPLWPGPPRRSRARATPPPAASHLGPSLRAPAFDEAPTALFVPTETSGYHSSAFALMRSNCTLRFRCLPLLPRPRRPRPPPRTVQQSISGHRAHPKPAITAATDPGGSSPSSAPAISVVLAPRGSTSARMAARISGAPDPTYGPHRVFSVQRPPARRRVPGEKLSTATPSSVDPAFTTLRRPHLVFAIKAVQAQSCTRGSFQHPR